MKRSWISKFAGLVLVLTLITTSLVAGTYAKYATQVAGSGSVTVAKWNAKLNYNTSSVADGFTFSLFDTEWEDSGVDEMQLAPGTEGSFTLAYDMSGTEVAHRVTIEMAAPELATDLSYIVFKHDNASGAAITLSTTGAITLFSQPFGPAAATSGSAVVYWVWPFDGNDAADTADGVADKAYPVAVTFSAIQLDTYPAP